MHQTKIYTVLFLLMIFFSCKNNIEPTQPHTNAIELLVQATGGTEVGHPMTFLARTKDNTRIPITLVLSNGIMTHTLRTYINKKTKIESRYFEVAGLYNLDVYKGQKLLKQKKFILQSRSSQDPLSLYCGPTTIVTGGKEPSMITAILSDTFDNPILDPLLVNYKSTGAQNFLSQATNEHLHASETFTSTKNADKLIISVTQEQQGAREQVVTQTADWGQGFSIELISTHPYADNRQYTRLKTDKILDQFGNPVPDGTLITYNIYDKDILISSYKAMTIDGIANVYLRNPKVAQEWKVQAQLSDASESNFLYLNFRPNLNKIAYSYDDFIKVLKVGPLNSVLGQYVPDGTIVEVKIGDQKITKETNNGYATINLLEEGILNLGTATLTVSGVRRKIELR